MIIEPEMMERIIELDNILLADALQSPDALRVYYEQKAIEALEGDKRPSQLGPLVGLINEVQVIRAELSKARGDITIHKRRINSIEDTRPRRPFE